MQIIGGQNNSIRSRNEQVIGSMYAAHSKNAIKGLHFDEQSKLNCPSYEGNKNNWQLIYGNSQSNSVKNTVMEKYIEENKNEIAREVGNIIGFKCVYSHSQSKLFKNMYQSFKENKGLYLPPNYFVPEYIPRLIIVKANPVKCWGYIPHEKVKMKIQQNKLLSQIGSMMGQFKPDPRLKVQLVGTLNNDSTPTKIIIKLIDIKGRELILNRVSAKIQL